MLQLKLLSTLSFLTIAIGLSAQEAPSKLIAPDTIPFQLTEHNNLSVPAILNDQDTLQLMLHTAASGLTVITEAVSNCLASNSQKQIPSKAGVADKAQGIVNIIA